MIRLLNQSRKRARTAHKFEETKTVMVSESTERSTEMPENNVTKDDALEQNLENMLQKTIGLNSNTSNVEVERNENEVPKRVRIKLPENHLSETQFTASNLQNKIKKILRSESKSSSDKNTESEAASKINSEYYLDDEYTDHYLPQQVDTSNIAGQIVQVINLHSFFYISKD